ncbi:carboxypeptidase-like regulatory domain-containing protein, partial [Aegicerativicinus sediminis]
MKNLLLLSLLLVTHSIVSQNNITGTIKDTEGNPVIFANIYLPQLEKGTFTDDSGTFELKSLPTGTYKIVVSLLGFDTYSDDIRIPLNSPLLVVLESSAIEMDEVVISTPFHKLQRDNVMKVEQQSLAEIKAQGAMTLGEGIANISGVNTISTGVGISKPVIRGLSSNRVLVYTQGIRMENQQFGDEHGLGINEAGISSVEVIKGPASLLYGSDALGGVLYLNPERFASEDSLDVSISSKYFGNTQGFANSLGAKTSSENFKFLIRGSLTNHSDYNTPEYRVTNSRFNEKDVKAGFGYQKGKFRSELRYNYNFAELGMPEEIGEQTTEKHPEMPFQEVASHILSNKSQFYFG